MSFPNLKNLFVASKSVSGPEHIATTAAKAIHPYFPVEAAIINYIPNSYSVPTLLGIFAAGSGAILGATYLGLSKVAPWVNKGDKFTILWFILSGCIHTFFEGYFIVNHERMGPANNIFGQLWKEYAFSDSRYLFSDPFVVCMESITAIFWGPLCFVAVYLITVQHPLRHPIQAIVSLGQLYGDVLYYATSLFDHYFRQVSYCRPEAYYFWVYFVLMNWFWIVIPGYLLYQSSQATARAFRALDRMTKSLKANGTSLANGNATGNEKREKVQ